MPAKLVLTDALIAESLRRGKAQQRAARQQMTEDEGQRARGPVPSSVVRRPPSDQNGAGTAHQPNHFQPAPAEGRRAAQSEGE